ncbi:hypothetical protein C8T65DRAFT_741064 [Cerioporus squamosus]|nr:hypothetical protein C8T65DRAFT_741064 [Cerioporus squamosus]
MSSDADASTAAIVALFDSFYSDTYCDIAASALFIYDTFVTLDREVAFFWTAKWTGAPLLFFANKWISITFYTMDLVSFALFPSDKRQVCSLFQLATTAIQILQFVPGAVFSALRAYVLSKSKGLALLILGLSLAPVGANMVPFGYHITGENFPPFGCIDTDDTTPAINLRSTFIIISRVPLMVADLLLIYITWTNLSSQGALRNPTVEETVAFRYIVLRWSVSLQQIFKRGLGSRLVPRYTGMVYFVVLFILNTLHLVFSLKDVAGNTGAGSYVPLFTAPFTAILVSRFLLDLQEANQAVVRVDRDDPLHSSRDPYDTPSFISSLGTFINPGLPATSEDEHDLHVLSRPDAEEGGDSAQAPQLAVTPSSSSA